MKTKAVRLYGENDVRLEEFELPPLGDGEILIEIISDSVCMSTYKTIKQGARHLRVPENIAENPIIIGHEFCGRVVAVSEKWKAQYAPGDKVVMPPVLSYLDPAQTVGYAFGTLGGVSTHSIVYNHIIENGFLLKVDSDAFFSGSLLEPVSCVIRGYKANIHLDDAQKPYSNLHPGGKTAILAGCGPMGLVAIDIALHGDTRPSLLVVTDTDEERLRRAEEIFPPEKAKEDGITLIFSNATTREAILPFTEGTGFDDVFVYAPVPSVVELADSLLGFDGCLNFFAGPLDKAFCANLNFYDVHYAQHHVAGTSGSTLSDMHDALRLISEKRINPAVMITHIGGMDAAIDTTVRLPQIGGGKKLIYTHIDLPLTAIKDFDVLGKTDARFKTLADIVHKNGDLWCAEAEAFLCREF